MPLRVNDLGEVFHVRPVAPVSVDRVPNRREVLAALVALRAKHGSTSRHELDILARAFSHFYPGE